MTRKPKKPAPAKKRPAKLQVHITYLEMNNPLLRVPPVPTRPSVALMVANNIQPGFYRYLYEMVGKDHHWEERRTLPDHKLEDAINDPDCAISVLYADGCPAGFFEIDKTDLPNSVEIKYFGLGKAYQGLGLGKWFLATAISSAWSHKPERVLVETNTLDHPAALPLYQRLGFSPTGVGDAEIDPWI